MFGDLLWSLGTALLAVSLIFGAACELYTLAVSFSYIKESYGPISWCYYHRRFSKWPKAIIKVLQDYRSGILYNPLPGRKTVIIRSPDLMRELSEAPELSQRAVYADIFGFKHTMSKGNVQWDPNETNLFRYRLFSRAIRIQGLSQIENLYPHLHKRLLQTLDMKIEPILKDNAWTRLRITPVMQDFATGMLGIYHFGESLCEEPEFSTAMNRYYDDTVACMGAMQVLPKFLHSAAHALITNNGHALTILMDRLCSVASSDSAKWAETSSLKPLTLLSNMLEASAESSYWTHELVFQALLGIWFAASHQPWINLHFAFLELCARPKDAEIIYREIQAAEPLSYEKLTQLPLLDSFIKEAVRVNPLDRMGVRRKALKSYTFTNGGPHVAKGQIACVPAWDLMHDSSKYPSPDIFDPHRFVPNAHDIGKQGLSNPMKGTTFTDASKDFPIWGLGSKVCPGRWHASLVIKMALAQMVAHYEFRLEADPASYRWFWETWQMPYKSSHVLIRKRNVASH